MSAPGPRRWLLVCGAALVSLLLLLAGSEALVRSLVSEQTFWPISNIYQRTDLPGVGYTYRPGFSGGAFGVGLEINSAGFRGSAWSPTAAEGVSRIALLGDSVAFGYGVRFDDSMGEVLEDLLDTHQGIDAEVLGFGVNGFNTRQQSALLHQVVIGYGPDLVVLLVTNNDAQAAMNVDRQGWLHSDRSDDPGSRVHDKAIYTRKPDETPGWLTQNSRLVLYLRVIARRRELLRQSAAGAGELPNVGGDWTAPLPDGPLSERLRTAVRPGLIRMIDTLSARDIPLVIASYCSSIDYRQMFDQLERARGVAVVSLFALFPEVRNWEQFVSRFGLGWDDHPNAEAHHRFAKGLVEVVAERLRSSGKLR